MHAQNFVQIGLQFLDCFASGTVSQNKGWKRHWDKKLPDIRAHEAVKVHRPADAANAPFTRVLTE